MQINEGLFGARARAGLRILIAAVAVAMLAHVPANASSFKVLHSFCKKLYCGDGYGPQQGLTIDQAGNLYGTASGGAHNSGIVFELVSPTTGKKWQYSVLYDFCALSNCADGDNPAGSTLVVDTAGNVYGTTNRGGAGNDTGTVFELSPPTKGHHWRLHTIYNFCAAVSSCHDGENPNGGLTYAGREAGLPYDGVSPLYGVAANGGGHFGGVAYSLTPKTSGHWLENVLYAFCAKGGQSCTDGADPIERLTMDSSGNLYGTTDASGTNETAVAFELSPQQGTGKMTESVLQNFCASCSVVSGLSLDDNGDLFGSSWRGSGSGCDVGLGCGFVFKIAADRTFSVVYNFCSLQQCVDGYRPFDKGGLYVDNLGKVYGTTQDGGEHGDTGTIFQLSDGAEQVMHSFCAKTACVDGVFPDGGLAIGPAGNFFGTTGSGGQYGFGGTVFELTP